MLDHKNTHCWQCQCQLPSAALLWLKFGNHRCTEADQKPHRQVSPGNSIQIHANPLSANPDLVHFLQNQPPKNGKRGQSLECFWHWHFIVTCASQAGFGFFHIFFTSAKSQLKMIDIVRYKYGGPCYQRILLPTYSKVDVWPINLFQGIHKAECSLNPF